MPADLCSFVRALLEREPEARLGAGGVGDVRNHPFLGANVEWTLLEQHKLVAPFVPDSHLVYTPDVIGEFSGEFELPSAELLEDFKDWRFDGTRRCYREELRQFVQKSSTRQILKSMRAPDSVLTKFVSETATHSENSDKDSKSETNSAELGDWDNAEIDDYDSDEQVSAPSPAPG